MGLIPISPKSQISTPKERKKAVGKKETNGCRPKRKAALAPNRISKLFWSTIKLPSAKSQEVQYELYRIKSKRWFQCI